MRLRIRRRKRGSLRRLKYQSRPARKQRKWPVGKQPAMGQRLRARQAPRKASFAPGNRCSHLSQCDVRYGAREVFSWYSIQVAFNMFELRLRECSSMVEPQPSKLMMRVRFPSLAPFIPQRSGQKFPASWPKKTHNERWWYNAARESCIFNPPIAAVAGAVTGIEQPV